ncbi:restriction endonuclease subunit S [Maribacter aquivivus]|uniref:restriction endonuclease subunit S n=1 Tax=Maribacter aquivivus TaxID=228958 RepID=UPI002493BED0|nr:restriction endonuclease subunit S [Maribacter aquivivus]|tara:strand:+ start:2588 stop:4618 length:2031 start_codon:yes stop_codon:yes gene_type:complete
MKKEFEILEDVVLYLESLGYAKESLKYEVPIDSHRRVDLVVTSGDSNLVAVEVKSDSSLFSNTNDIGFSPIARQLQKSAQQLGADYYIISNGVKHLWLKTNEIGRPSEIEQIHRNDFGKKKLSNKQYLQILLDHVSSFLQNFPITGDLSFDLSLVIYRKTLLDLGVDFILSLDSNFVQNKSSEDLVQNVLERWKGVNFIDDKEFVLKYIDDFLIKNKYDWHVPRWLSNFMVSLYPEGKPKIELLDIFSKYGTLISSAHNNNWINVESFYLNKNNEYWIKSQQSLSSEKPSNTVFTPDLLTDTFFGIVNNKFDCVLVAPPFGFKVMPKFGLNKIDSIVLMVSKGLDRCKTNGYVIAIVPDGFLLSSSFKKFRNKLLIKHTVKGIINLTPDTFKPYSAVSTSILIIHKNNQSDDETFFASFDSVPKTNDVTDHIILKKWKLFLNKNRIENELSGFTSDNLNIENFHFSNYWYRDFQYLNESLNSKFQAIPLKELVSVIKRGNTYKRDKKEDIPYLAPAAIRSMKILEEGFSYTSGEKIPNNPIKSEIDDIIINIIGTQKGSAAIVTDKFKGLGLNQHLVLLRPNLNLIKPYYLTIALNSDYVQKQFEDSSTGSVIPSLNLKSFESIYIPVPPFVIQEKICGNYNKKINLITEQEIALNKEKQDLNKMFSDLGKEGDLL